MQYFYRTSQRRNGRLRAKTCLSSSAQLCECLVPIFTDIFYHRHTKSKVYHPSQEEDRLLSTAEHSHPARERPCRSWERWQPAAEHNNRGQNSCQEVCGSKRPGQHGMQVNRLATRWLLSVCDPTESFRLEFQQASRLCLRHVVNLKIDRLPLCIYDMMKISGLTNYLLVCLP